MAINDLLKSDTGKGFLMGIGVAIAAPVAIAALATSGRPVAKAAIKTGLLMYEKGMEKLAELNETFEDVLAEARAEVDEELMEGAMVAEAGELKKTSAAAETEIELENTPETEVATQTETKPSNSVTDAA